jgi:hypothetical protein
MNVAASVNQCLPAAQCSFTINDSYNDGICCHDGVGFYAVVVDGVPTFTCGQFTPSESKTFGTCGVSILLKLCSLLCLHTCVFILSHKHSSLLHVHSRRLRRSPRSAVQLVRPLNLPCVRRRRYRCGQRLPHDSSLECSYEEGSFNDTHHE